MECGVARGGGPDSACHVAHTEPHQGVRATIEPGPGSLRALIRGGHGNRADERSRRFREQMGLPVGEKPLVLGGHQPVLWHGGIAAKWVALDVLREKLGVDAAWLVVDHDVVDPWTLRYPVQREGGGLSVAEWAIAPAQAGDEHGVVGAGVIGLRGTVRSSAPPVLGARDPTGAIGDGLARLAGLVDAHAGASSGAEQATRVMCDLMGPVSAPLDVVYSTSVGKTDLFWGLIERMVAEPSACARAYNAAARSVPEAGVGGLAEGELPVWRLDRVRGVRSGVRVDDIAVGEPRGRLELAPKALLQTALLRLAGCELFVHGTGGSVYDRITERWIGDWLGEGLSPTAMATADVRLDLEGGLGDESELARARQRAHSAAHNPGELGDSARQQEKHRLLGEIASAGYKSVERARLFDELHALLARARAEHEQELDNLTEQSAGVGTALAQARIAQDRTWSVALLGGEKLTALRREVERELAGV